MKTTFACLLFLSILFASCGREQHIPASSLQPDSVRVAFHFYRKAWKAAALDSVEWYAGLACRYLTKKQWQSRVYFDVASRCMEAGEPAKALRYYGKAGDEADSWMQGRLCETIPQAYASMGRFADAIRSLDSIRSDRSSRTVVPYYNLAKGNLYVMVNRSDSARHYYEIAANSLNRWVAGMASHRLRLLYAAAGADSLAYAMSLNADKQLKDEILKEESVEAREDYEREKMQNELNRLKIDKQSREILLLSLGLGFILVAFLFYFLLQRRKRQTDRLLLDEKTIRLEQAGQLLNQTDQLLKQTEELTHLREKESQLRESLFRRMKSFHKIPSLEEDSDEDSETTNHRIVLSTEDWEDIRKTVDKSYDNFTRRLLQSFPELSEKDVNFCCLVKIGVSIKDLSDIYCISRTSISRKKQRMKRDKLALPAEDETLDLFLSRF